MSASPLQRSIQALDTADMQANVDRVRCCAPTHAHTALGDPLALLLPPRCVFLQQGVCDGPIRNASFHKLSP